MVTTSCGGTSPCFVLGLLTVALVATGAPQNDVQCEKAHVGEDVHGPSLRYFLPQVDGLLHCIRVHLQVRAEDVIVEGRSEETPGPLPSLPVSRE